MKKKLYQKWAFNPKHDVYSTNMFKIPRKALIVQGQNGMDWCLCSILSYYNLRFKSNN